MSVFTVIIQWSYKLWKTAFVVVLLDVGLCRSCTLEISFHPLLLASSSSEFVLFQIWSCACWITIQKAVSHHSTHCSTTSSRRQQMKEPTPVHRHPRPPPWTTLIQPPLRALFPALVRARDLLVAISSCSTLHLLFFSDFSVVAQISDDCFATQPVRHVKFNKTCWRSILHIYNNCICTDWTNFLFTNITFNVFANHWCQEDTFQLS